MSKSKLARVFSLAVLFLFNLTVCLKLPHLLWTPSFMGTWFTSKGLIYYRDFIQTHFPLSHFIVYPFLKLFNWNLEVEPFFSFVILLLTLIFIYFIKKSITLSNKGFWISGIFLSTLFWYFSTWVQYSQEALIGLILTLVFLLLTRAYSSKTISPKNLFFMGILLSFAELSGQIVSPVVIVFIISILIMLKIKSSDQQRLIKNMFIFGLGIFFPIMIMGTYFLTKGVLADSYYWNVPYYLIYSKLSQARPGFLPTKDIVLFYLPPLILIFSLLTTKRKTDDFPKIVLLLLCIFTIPSVIFSVFHPHHFLFGLPIISLSWVYILRDTKNKRLNNIFLLSAIFVTGYLLYSKYPWYKDKLKFGLPTINLSKVTKNDTQLETIAWLNKNSTQSDRIIVVGDPILYYRADRLPANKYVSVLPWHYLPIDKTANEFKINKPKFWVIDNVYRERLLIGWKSPEIIKFISNELLDYKIVYKNTEWEIWKKI